MTAASKRIGLALLLALSVWGCQVEATRVAELEDPEAVVASEAEPDSGETVEAENAGEEASPSSGGGSGGDPVGGLGLLGPIVPGFSPDLVSSSCNPLDDPYATCL